MPANAAPTIPEQCQDCGVTFLRAPGRRKHRCLDCGMRRMMRSAEQSMARSGSIYESIVRKQLAHWTSEARRLGIELDA